MTKNLFYPAIYCSFCLLALACSNPPPAGDAAADGQDAVSDNGTNDAEDVAAQDAVDVVLPPGPRGQVLAVPEMGSVVIPTLTADVNVVYTEAHVPHVYAASSRDANVVQGFLLGRDRYFQVELQRRVGLGTVSELLGERGMALDTQARGRGYRVIAERLLTQMGAQELEALDAYAEGFNAYVMGVRARPVTVPPEVRAIGLVLGLANPAMLMQPIARQDLAAVLALVLANSSFSTDDLERANAASVFSTLYTGLAANSSVTPAERAARRELVRSEIFDRVNPLTDVTSALGFSTDQRMGSMASVAPNGGALLRSSSRRSRSPRQQRASNSHRNELRVARAVIERALAATEPLEHLRRGGRDADYGSNAWALSGRGTADGSALLAGDGHLPLSIPTLLYQLHQDTTVFSDAMRGESQIGLFFPGIPFMALGTNGRVAYSFTYLYGDLTDWYAERIQLDAMGRPQCAEVYNPGTMRNDCVPLTSVNESYVIADVPLLMSRGRTDMWTRYTTRDGKYFASIEGDVAMPGQVAPAGRSIVDVMGQRVIPRDVDNDGVISAITFDYVGFDVSNVPGALREFSQASTVRELRNAQRRFVAFAQNFVGADSTGAVYYSGFTGAPCRGYLERVGVGAARRWAPGADPRMLLDGTKYRGFSIPLDAMGRVDDTRGAMDAYQCALPFDAWPQSIDPERGYTLTANNDLVGTTFDNNLANDQHYLGGPYDVGYRARSIRDALAGHVQRHDGSVDTMAALQANHKSQLGPIIVPAIASAIERARAIAGGMPAANDSETRMSQAYLARRASIDEALRRMQTWITRGAVAESGVSTFYDTPTMDQQQDAVATMIFNGFYRTLQQLVLGDEAIDRLLDTDSRFLRGATMVDLLANRGANPSRLGSYDAMRQESLFWDDVRTPEIERSPELIVSALSQTIAALTAVSPTVGEGGFGTADMNQWLWGLRHQVALESIITAYAGGVMGIEPLTNLQTINTRRLPLAMGITAPDPRAGLQWFPRPGDFYNVDAANPPNTGVNWVYRNGPVMRMVIELKNGRVRGQNVIPAGQNGANNSQYFDDQARLWLGNRALPMRYTVDEVVSNATGRERFSPR